MYKVKVLSGYRVSIPKEVGKRLGLKIGDELILEIKGSQIVLRPCLYYAGHYWRGGKRAKRT